MIGSTIQFGGNLTLHSHIYFKFLNLYSLHSTMFHWALVFLPFPRSSNSFRVVFPIFSLIPLHLLDIVQGYKFSLFFCEILEGRLLIWRNQTYILYPTWPSNYYGFLPRSVWFCPLRSSLSLNPFNANYCLIFLHSPLSMVCLNGLHQSYKRQKRKIYPSYPSRSS